MDFIIRTCKASDLDLIDINCPVKKYEAGKKCSSILKEARTVFVIGAPVTPEMDVVKKGILGDDFPSYKLARDKAKELAAELKQQGFQAKVTVGISIKNACVLSGIGVFGKNSLIINPTYGTYLRFACVLTDYIPEQYDSPLTDYNPCGDCDLCLQSCPSQCLTPYQVDGLKCLCTYVEKGQKPLSTLPMCDLCQSICPHNAFLKANLLDKGE